MTCKNIGVVFGPTFMRCEDQEKDFEQTLQKNILIEKLVQYYPQISTNEKEINIQEQQE